ncbi:nuclear transport factor 2 family protein [Aldersonia kunmingensis]|uniref:nuclear transport factor 2 family protein n=1 Tax=Aldersonia kunmingensis TaxID=408066 RepID=UPI0008351DDE|nr:nuclear transport factor 2 family protein [Aldersonia kunmingensis]
MTTAAPTTAAATVAEIYAAFGRGDIPYILSQLSPTVEWDTDAGNYAARAGIPAIQPRRSPDEVAGFFAEIAPWTFHKFEVKELLTAGNSVAAVIDLDYSVPNGGRMAGRELHLWEFGPDGKVASYQHFLDTARFMAAHEGVDTSA